jgi:hypothetical protein
MHSCPVTLGACLIVGVYVGLIATLAFASYVHHSFYTPTSSVLHMCRIKARRFELGSILQQILDGQTEIFGSWRIQSYDCEVICSQGSGYVTLLPLSLNLPTVYAATSYIALEAAPSPTRWQRLFTLHAVTFVKAIYT